jgi:ABC-type Fe3+ transport system substrate-binding protein
MDDSPTEWELRASATCRPNGRVSEVWSDGDATPVLTATGGIFKDAPHPNTAKLYVSWYLAKEQQSRPGTFSVRADSAMAGGSAP